MPDSTESTTRRPLHPREVVLLVIATMTLVGVCFVGSSPPDRIPDGSRTWTDGSLLHSITSFLALNFSIPTPNGVAAKELIAAIGASLAVICAGFAAFLAAQARRSGSVWVDDETLASEGSRGDIQPHSAAVWMCVATVGLSFLSAWWSTAPDYAIGGSILLLGHVAWAVSLRYGLGAAGARAVLWSFLIVLAVCAAFAIWYFFERNPHLRAGYPVGNPLFLAACLLPVVCCGAACLCSGVVTIRQRGLPAIGMVIFGLAIIVPSCWAIRLTDSRGAILGLAAAAAVVAILALQSKIWRISSTIVTCVAGVATYSLWFQPMLVHRPETVRTRIYAWQYAEQLFSQAPIVGHGQGGYARLADALAAQDAPTDPRAVRHTFRHAHNEWLEVAADLGSVGLVLTLGVFVLTLWGACRALSRCHDHRDRWLLLGLIGTLVAMCVEESTDVAVRVAGFPTVFYGFLGLTWAVVAGKLDRRGSAVPHKSLSIGLLAGTIAVAGGITATSIWSFRGARAAHDMSAAIRNEKFDEAVRLAQFARQARLNPSRKLTSALDEIQCHYQIAAANAEDYQLAYRKLEVGVGNPVALQEAAQRYWSAMLGHSLEALRLVDVMSQTEQAPTRAYIFAGEVHALLRNTVQEETLQQESAQLASQSYRHVVARRPFDTSAVLRLVELSPQLSIAEIINVMCGPMRFGEVDERYFTIIRVLAADPQFDSHLAPLLARGLSAELGPDTLAASPFTAEIVRMSALAEAVRGNFKLASDRAQRAVELSERNRDRFPLAHAIALRESAHYQFLASPQTPAEAIAAARAGLAELTDSFDDRPSKLHTKRRLAMYILAGGSMDSESEALEVAEDLFAAAPSTGRLQRLAALYDELCRTLIDVIPHAQRPSYVADRLATLITLAPDAAGPYELAARHALDGLDLAQATSYLEHAMERGTALSHVLGWVSAAAGNAEDRAPYDALITAWTPVGPPAPPPPGSGTARQSTQP
jgi:hypothetical protein